MKVEKNSFNQLVITLDPIEYVGRDITIKEQPMTLLLLGAGPPGYGGSGSPPVNLLPPSISGDNTPGSTLTVTPGIYSGGPAVTRQWTTVNGDGSAAIPGETGLTCVVPQGIASNFDTSIYCEETANNGFGVIFTDSNRVGPIFGVSSVQDMGGSTSCSWFFGDAITCTGGNASGLKINGVSPVSVSNLDSKSLLATYAATVNSGDAWSTEPGSGTLSPDVGTESGTVIGGA